MSFSDGGQGAGDSRFMQRGLLASPGEWALPLGASQAPILRRVAQALLGMSAALLVWWLITLGAEAKAGQGSWLALMLAGMAGLVWSSQAWRMFSSLRQTNTVALRWGGLPPFKPRASESATDLPGWSLVGGAHPQSVSVHVVFDLGRWLLVKMVPAAGQVVGAAEVWSWLDARRAFDGHAGHQLRALLFNRRANLVGAPQAGGGADPVTVASSGNRQRQWPNLLAPTSKPLQVAGPHAHHADKAFADTVIEERRLRA